MRRLSLFACACLLAAACSEDSTTGPDENQDPEFATLTVDASNGWALVRLGEPASLVTVADPAASDAWDLGLFATSVMLNGGVAGPAGVVGHCLCANASATDAQVMAMTAESELAAFEAVTAGDVPAAGEAWEADALAPAIDGWYRYDPATHVVSAAPDRVWKVRTRAGSFAKLHVVAIEGGTQTSAGRVTVEFAAQDAAGAPMGEPVTVTLDGTSGRAYLDLVGGGGGTAEAWDIALEGWDLRVNGGVSGDGGVGAVLGGESFAEMTDAGDAPSSVYAADAFGGVFEAHPWYRYNLQDRHQIWPVFNVYLIRRGDDVWKVQLTGYYDETGKDRQVTLRYARVGS